jgi:hypothetical protein
VAAFTVGPRRETNSMKCTVWSCAVFVMATLLAGCGSLSGPFQKSPGDVVKAFYLAANEGRYSEAEQMLSEDAQRAIKGDLGQLAGGFKSICDKNTKDGTIVRIDIQKEELRGEGATVVAKISFKDGSTKEGDKNALLKEKGAWKLTIGE